MKTFRLLAVLLLQVLFAGAVGISISELRNGLKGAAVGEEQALRFMEKLKQSEPKSPLIKGYMAATEGLLAKHAWFPGTKYSWCVTSLDHFRDAIKADPENLELRYLRLNVETNIPGFLGMNGDVAEDRKKAFELLASTTDLSLRRDVARFLNEKGGCSEEEKKRLRPYLD
ncbi:MAG: hypothetical protein RL213_586 [Bacteroidota bacterium]|jgi:hypothetical protein